MEKDGLATTRRVMLVIMGLLMVALAALYAWFLNRSWDTTAFICSWLLVGCVGDFVEWWLVRKDPEPPVAKWMHSPVYLTVSGIGACAFSYLLIQSWPTSHSELIAGFLFGLCFAGMRAYGVYLQRKRLQGGQASDLIPPAEAK